MKLYNTLKSIILEARDKACEQREKDLAESIKAENVKLKRRQETVKKREDAIADKIAKAESLLAEAMSQKEVIDRTFEEAKSKSLLLDQKLDALDKATEEAKAEKESWQQTQNDLREALRNFLG
jgi:predicted RNA-binding Zn ribbon-like protein